MQSTVGGGSVVRTNEAATASNTTLSAAAMATGIAITNNGTAAYTMDTGANIAANAILAPFNTTGAVFKVLVCNSSNTAKTLTAATGVTISGGTSIASQGSRLLHFVNTWSVY